MVSVQSPPGRRELPYARVLLLPAIVMAAATGAAVAAVQQPARAAVGWCGAIATLLVIAVAAEAVRRGRELRDQRLEHARHTADLQRRIADQDQDLTRFAKEIAPTALDWLRRGSSPGEVIRQLGDVDPAWANLPEAQIRLLKTVLNIVDT
jgi:hypothetical protein